MPMKPSERDLHLAMELANSVIFDWEPEDHPADYENLGNDIANKVAVLLAKERASLPETVALELTTCIKYLSQELCSCDETVGFVCCECSMHRGLTYALQSIRRWQQGEGPEPRKDGA